MPTFGEALRLWAYLGCVNFGGPAGQIALMHKLLVDDKRWIGDARFFHALNYCMLLPGPEAQQLATYIGWLMHGVRGGLAAGLLFILPGSIVMLALSILYVNYADLALVDPARTWTIRAAGSPSTQGYTPFEGLELSAQVTTTFLRGHKIHENGEVLGAPRGQYLHRPTA